MHPKRSEFNLKIADVEVGGDIHRIVLGGVRVPEHLETASEARKYFMEEMDDFRKLLISYPYGHEDMCVDFLFPSRQEDIKHAYVIMECMGYPYFSGSNTIATIAALHEYGLKPQNDGISTMFLEAPVGVVSAETNIINGRIEGVTVNGGAAYVLQEDIGIHVPGIGKINYNLVWSGDYFVIVNAKDLDIHISEDHIPAMKEYGKKIIDEFRTTFTFIHPEYEMTPPPGFIHFIDEREKLADKHYRGRGATFGYPNTIWNCPTGTGTAARMALMWKRGEIEVGSIFESISPMNNKFIGHALHEDKKGIYDALETEITARPFVLETLDLHLDFENPLMEKYISVRNILSNNPYLFKD